MCNLRSGITQALFQKHALPEGEFMHRDRPVRLEAIRDTALMTVEGGADDITGRGQTEAALGLCPKLPKARKRAYVAPKVGHYGVFHGSRFRAHIQPKIRDFIHANRAVIK